MRRRCAAFALAVLPLLAGCDFSFSLLITSVDSPAASQSAAAASDAATDGDVRADGTVETAAVILAGVDPLAPASPEYRGFLSFPIGGIPVGAWIESASVTVRVDRVQPSGPALLLSFDHVRYGGTLSFAAFNAPGSPVGGLPAGVTLFPSGGPQAVAFDVAPELQTDVNDPAVGFFQLRARASGGLASIVDGAGNRAFGLPSDRSLAPVLSVVYRP